MIEPLFWGCVLRISQAGLQAAPFIFTGLCVAGMLHRLMGHAHTKWLFGSNTAASLFQSWVIGMLLPGCSLGTIAIVKQLRRSGIAVGTIFAFALSSPLFDPLSLLYGLTLSKPGTILAFAGCSLVVVTVCGGLFDRWFPNTEAVVEEPPPTPPGIRRIAALLVVMARESVGSTAAYVAVGLTGVGLLALVLPAGSLQRSMAHENPWSPLLMTGIALPAYATPMTAMGQLGSMFQHGNSIGAAFILLIFGAGVNLGLTAWMAVNYGFRKTVLWFALMLGVVVGLSYGIERPLYPVDVEPADHTHAFDGYCQPFHLSASAPPAGYAGEVVRRLRWETQPHEIAGAAFLGLLVVLGSALAVFDRRRAIDGWLNHRPVVDPAAPVKKSFDFDVPRPVLVGIGVLVVAAGSVVGCYAYYPAVDEAIEEMKLAKTEALSAAMTGKDAHAQHWIPVCESWNRRLQVGAYLRSGRLTEERRLASRAFQDELEVLEHNIEDEDPREEVAAQVNAVSQSVSKLVRVYSKKE
ncbi:MAG: permease [Planctomycetia bacterium]